METMSNKQGVTLAICFILCNCFSYLYGSGNILIPYVLASFLTILVWFLLISLIDKHGFSSFFEMLDFAFGGIIGKIVAFFLLIYALLSSTTTMTIFGKFTQISALTKTPQVVLPFIILVLAALSLKAGLRILSHGADILFGFAAFTLISFVIFSFPQLDTKNIVTFVGDDLLLILKNTLSVFTNQFGDIIILLCIYPHVKQNPRRRKFLLLALIIACGVVSLIALFTVLTLGKAQTAQEFFPVFTILSIRSVGSFIQHMEILTSIAMTFFVFIRQVVNLYFSTVAIAHIFKTPSYKVYLLPASLIIVALTQLLYPNIISLSYRVESNLNLYILLPLQLILPTLLGLFLISKRKKEK